MQADGGWKTNVCLVPSPASGNTVSMTTQTHHNFAQVGLINKNICKAWLRDVPSIIFQQKKKTKNSWLYLYKLTNYYKKAIIIPFSEFYSGYLNYKK